MSLLHTAQCANQTYASGGTVAVFTHLFDLRVQFQHNSIFYPFILTFTKIQNCDCIIPGVQLHVGCAKLAVSVLPSMSSKICMVWCYLSHILIEFAFAWHIELLDTLHICYLAHRICNLIPAIWQL